MTFKLYCKKVQRNNISQLSNNLFTVLLLYKYIMMSSIKLFNNEEGKT